MKQLFYFLGRTVSHSCSLQKEVDMNYSCSPPGNSAGPAGKQELPAELQCGDKETCDTYCQEQGESPAGELAPSGTSFHPQSEDEDLDHCSSERPRKPRTITKPRGDNGGDALGDVFGEDLAPAPEEALPYRCKKCGCSFRGPNLLSKHKVIHREDKPYKCQECGMAFVQLLRLKRHQQTHSGARPFYCQECGGTFTRLASLQRHHRIHTGEKPYSCNFCGHSFTESGTLRRHERTHKSERGLLGWAGKAPHGVCSAVSRPAGQQRLTGNAASQGALEIVPGRIALPGFKLLCMRK
uniref:C2H2-type domain-containing protein n=1 Tax=Cyanoderma ruficeps TaxID=181631 RepID=A0A8C3NW91_9PASS